MSGETIKDCREIKRVSKGGGAFKVTEVQPRHVSDPASFQYL